MTPEGEIEELGQQIAWLLSASGDCLELLLPVQKRCRKILSHALRDCQYLLLIHYPKQVEVDPKSVGVFAEEANGHHVVDSEELVGNGGLDLRAAARAFGDIQDQALDIRWA
jgi:hypothetical protein